MVRETVAMETLATAATVRMSGVFAADLRDAFRATNQSYSRQQAWMQWYFICVRIVEIVRAITLKCTEFGVAIPLIAMRPR